ncbi:hypothetical protein CFP56_040187 [Quercus suber]|uniref:Reverse transcriptase zinc-binding domain-containing protein n=1 Tax=Quercus suber TaxID=58331 RepID=A0AAW0IZ36_QUESU
MELKGALKPSFRKRASELVQNHNLAILVVMETRVGGDRAREITSLLPFDGAIHTDTIGYAGGLWVLWNVDRVDIALLFSIEQKIHAEVKVRFINISWLFLAVYASPRNAERQVLWKNLMSVAELHNMPWVTAGDFNEPLLSEDKFGGRAKIKLFTWKASRDILASKENLAKRKITLDGVCEFCGNAVETIGHILWFCDHAKEVWRNSKLALPFEISATWKFLDVLEALLRCEHLRLGLLELFIATCWGIWKNRNELRAGGKGKAGMTWTRSDHGEGVTELSYRKKRKQCSMDMVAEEIELGRIVREWSYGAKSSDWQAFGSLGMCSLARVFGLFGLRENEGVMILDRRIKALFGKKSVGDK